MNDPNEPFYGRPEEWLKYETTQSGAKESLKKDIAEKSNVYTQMLEDLKEQQANKIQIMNVWKPTQTTQLTNSAVLSISQQEQNALSRLMNVNTDTLAVQYKLRGSTTPSVEVMRFTCLDNSSFNVDSNGTMASGIIKQLPEYTGTKLLAAPTAAETLLTLTLTPAVRMHMQCYSTNINVSICV
jgi:hypothetical protein